MKLIKAEDDPIKGLFLRMISENNLVEIGVYKVIFGFRVRGGFVDDKFSVVLDWCCGSDWSNVQRLYSILASILSKREENRHCFKDLPPFSKIKPFFMDEEFTKIVLSFCDKNFELIELEPINLSGMFQ